MTPGPLTGIRVIEFAGLGPAPYAGQLLADMGADVLVIARAGQSFPVIENRGKSRVDLDLKTESGLTKARALIKEADILTEGFRPGVMEKLGLGPEICHAINPRLIYGRMTGWGQSGPWARMAGHDINYIGLTGALYAMGRAGESPLPPLNLVGDYGGGSMFLIAGLLAALYAREKSGRGDVVDAAIIDGTASQFGLMLSLHAQGAWSVARGQNWLDGSRPYYRCYTCQCGGFFAVGALEPQFFAELLRLLEIDPETYGPQEDVTRFADQHQLLESRFATKTRDAWAADFDGVDACATPVLRFDEAGHHPQMAARGVYDTGAPLQARKAPRLSDWEDGVAGEMQRVQTHWGVILDR